MKKILTLVGARPQFIKSSPVSIAIGKNENLQEIFVHTGQHYDDNLSKIFFEELNLAEVKYNLKVGSSSHANQTGEIMIGLEPLLKKEQPDIVLIYGDTNSTLAGVITAVKLGIPTAHVEAGLRSYNRKMPEEINRIIADQLSSHLFVPTRSGVENLLKEGINEGVYHTGDVMYDVVLKFSEIAQRKSNILKNLGIKSKDYILLTVHRAENTDNKTKLLNIFRAISEINKDIEVVFPLHPRTEKMIKEFNLYNIIKDIKIIKPAGFFDMICLEKNARVIITDSGGVQKEAYFHKVPCVTLRDETEWIETVNANWNCLADVNSIDKIINNVNRIQNTDKMLINEYGEGNSAERIVEILSNV